MNNKYILIIADNNEAGKRLYSKIKLLRKSDEISICASYNAIEKTNETQPKIVIYLYSTGNNIELINDIKKISKAPIIFVTENINEEITMNAFNNGIDEFFSLNDSDYTILMRIFLTIQKTNLKEELTSYKDFLIANNIIEKNTEIYNSKTAPFVLKNLTNKILKTQNQNALIMNILPNKENGQNINIADLITEIKKIIRTTDIIAYGENKNIYLILYNTDNFEAKILAKKIKKTVNNQYKIFFNACHITKDFELINDILTKKMHKQKTNDITYEFITTAELNEQNEENLSNKTTQNSVNIYKITIPVFYQMQSILNEKLPNCKIEYSTESTMPFFSIEYKNLKCIMQIQTDFEIKIYYSYYFGDNIKETQETLSKQINEEILTEKITTMLNDFVQEMNLEILNE